VELADGRDRVGGRPEAPGCASGAEWGREVQTPAPACVSLLAMNTAPRQPAVLDYWPSTTNPELTSRYPRDWSAFIQVSCSCRNPSARASPRIVGQPWRTTADHSRPRLPRPVGTLLEFTAFHASSSTTLARFTAIRPPGEHSEALAHAGLDQLVQYLSHGSQSS
jgi:hypothetical protein